MQKVDETKPGRKSTIDDYTGLPRDCKPRQSYNDQEPFVTKRSFDRRVRIYVHVGNPPYTCYYNIKIKPNTTANNLIGGMMNHMKISEEQHNFRLTVQYSSGKLEQFFEPFDIVDVSSGEDNWPRLFLRRM